MRDIHGSRLRGRRAALLKPLKRALAVILSEKIIIAARERVAGQGAGGVPGDIESVMSVASGAPGVGFGPGNAELPRPNLLPVSHKLRDKRVRRTGQRQTIKAGRCGPSDKNI